MPVRNGLTTRTTTEVDDLFNTRPAPPTPPPAPPSVSPDFKRKLLNRAQEIWAQTPYASPPLLAYDKTQKLEKALADGDAVEIRLSQSTSAILKKSDDLESSTSFFVKRTAGFAGTQLFGPFDV